MLRSSVRVDRNIFARLAGDLHEQAAAAVTETAETVAAGMRQRASGRIAGTVEVTSTGTMSAEVTAGDLSGAIHAGFVEFGTVDRAAEPFAVPAAEEAGQQHIARMRHLLDRG